MKNIFTVIILIGLMVFMGCKKMDATNEREKIGDDLVNVLVEPVKQKNIEKEIQLSGKAEGIVDVDLTADINGRLVSLKKSLGDKVVKGEEIGRVESNKYQYSYKQAEANLLSAKASFDAVSLQLSADSMLYKEESISEHGLLMSKNRYQANFAQYKGAQANFEQAKINLERSVIKAPVSGIISYLPVKETQTINAQTVICSIVDDSKIIVRTGVGQNYINMIDKNDEVVVTYNNLETEIKGKVMNIGRSAKVGNSLYPIEIGFKNNGNVLSGMIVYMNIKKPVSKGNYAIKFTSLKQDYDRNYVYCVDKDVVVEKDIVLGKMVGEYVFVKSGLSEDDLLIVDSSGSIVTGQKVVVKQLN